MMKRIGLFVVAMIAVPAMASAQNCPYAAGCARSTYGAPPPGSPPPVPQTTYDYSTGRGYTVTPAPWGGGVNVERFDSQTGWSGDTQIPSPNPLMTAPPPQYGQQPQVFRDSLGRTCVPAGAATVCSP